MLPIILLISSVAILLFLALLLAGRYFYIIVLKPGGFARLVRNKPEADVSTVPPADPYAGPLYKEAEDWWNAVQAETLQTESHDGLRLQGYYVRNESACGRLAVLAHGYSGKATEMAVYAKIYYELGYDIFAPDNRGHGNSEGDSIGMGWMDRRDYLRWLELLNGQKKERPEIILHGHSMGGAIVSFLAGEESLPSNVKGIISDCAYDSVKNVLAWNLKYMFRLPPFPIIPVTSLICKRRAGYFLGEGNVAAQVARSRIPILFIHGEEDTFVPFSMVVKLYEAAPASFRFIWTVPGAGHIGSIAADYEGYTAKIKGFVMQTAGDPVSKNLC